MSGNFPTSGSSPPPPPSSPSRTLFISLAACMFLISFAVLLVTVFLLCCRLRRDRSSALPGDRCGGDPFPVEATLPAFSYVVPEDGEGDQQGGSVRECPVCLGVVKEGEMVRQLPACSHLYHVVCIDRWLAEHRTCPIDAFDVGVGSSTGGPGGGRCTHPPEQSPV
nr:unnamed protein product [Digitaria exilis]